MSRHQNDPLRPLTPEERMALTRLSRSLSAPAAQVRACPSTLGHRGWGQLHGCGPPGRATAHRDHLRLGKPLQP